MKSRVKLTAVLLVAGVLVCAGPAHGVLWLRTTFNEPDVAPGAAYQATGTMGDADIYWLREGGEGSLETVDGKGGGVNKAVKFDAVTDELETRRFSAPGIDTLPVTLLDGGMSFGYWVNVDVHAAGYMSLYALWYNYGTTDTGMAHGLKYAGTTEPYENRSLLGETWQNPWPNSQTEFTAGEWHHLVITVDGAAQGSKTEKFYVDGQWRATSLNRTIELPGYAARIGGFFSGGVYKNPYYGLIDQVDIWDTDLDLATVQAEFNAGPVPEPATMVLLCGGMLLGLRRRR